MVALVAAGLKPDIEYPLTGEHVNLSLTVRNDSDTLARGVQVVLSASKTRVGSNTIDIPGRHSVVTTFAWTPVTAGAYQLIAQVDPERRQTEENRSDNVAALDLGVAESAMNSAVFTVSDVGLATQNGLTLLRARVQNTGTAPASAPIIFRIQKAVVATRYVETLASGASTLIEVPIPTPVGAVQVSAQINPRFGAGAQPLISKQVGLSTDVRIDGLSISSPKFEESRTRRVTISFQIVNAGLSAITTPFRTRISPGVVSNGVLGDDFVTTNELAAGQAIYVSRTLIAPPSEFDIRVEADADQAIQDQDRSNNTATAHFKNPSANVDRWVQLGPRRIDNEGGIGAVGALFHLAINPQNPATIYVGGNNEGIWKTTDSGQNWQPITDSLPSLRSSALAMDPSNPEQLYLLTPDEGVLKTTDGGGSWAQLESPNFQPNIPGLPVMRVHPTNPNLLFVTGNQGVNLYQANAPSGSRWTVPLNLGAAVDLVFDPANANNVFATLVGSATVTGIYTSVDSGSHWQKAAGCPGAGLPDVTNVTQITMAFAGPTTLYAAFRGPNQIQVYRTTGQTCQANGVTQLAWEPRFSAGASTASVLWNRIDADPGTENTVYLSGIQFFVSTDGAQTFNVQSGTQPHADHHNFAVAPTARQNIYVVCDGGIYLSTNRGAANSWSFIGDGIFNVQFYAFSVAETDQALTIGGTQDNGTISYTGSTIWNQINGGDGATTAIDPTNDQIQYSMNQYVTSMQKQTGNGGWQCISCGYPIGPACFNVFFQLDPTSPASILASCGPLMKATSPVCSRCPNWSNNDPGAPNAWSVILPQSSISGSVVLSAVDRSTGLYYAGTSSGQVWAGPSGTNWQLLFTGGSAVTDIEVDRDDPTTVYVGFNTGSAGGIYRMHRLNNTPTASSISVVDITSNLPSGLNVQALAVDRMNAFTVMAGTNAGMYRGQSSDSGATWSWARYMNGFPIADVREMAVQPTTGVLRAATFGRGVYEVNTGDAIGSLLSASGKITFLRGNDVGTGFGPPSDFLDAEVIIQLDTQPGKSFGFQLRADTEEPARTGMLDTLRSAFRSGRSITIDYYRTGIHNGRIIRVAKIN